jgi:hypothetical protein
MFSATIVWKGKNISKIKEDTNMSQQSQMFKVLYDDPHG